MKKRLKILLCLMTTLSLMLAMSAGAYAAQESFEITGAGSVTVSISGDPVFTAASHSETITMGSDIIFTGSNNDIYITDETGTNSGWMFGIATTDFYLLDIDDPTDANSETMDVYVFSCDWLSLTLDNSAEAMCTDDNYTLIPGTGGDGGVVPADQVQYFGGAQADFPPNCSTTTLNNANIIKVSPGYGAGKYYFDLNYIITIDEWLPDGTVVDSTATGGRFNDMSIAAGDKVQVFAGVYTTNMVYSASCNPAS